MFLGVRTADELVSAALKSGLQGPGVELALHWGVRLDAQFDNVIFVFPREDHYRAFGATATGPKRYRTLRKRGGAWADGWTHEPVPEGATFAILVWEKQETIAVT